MYGKGYKEYKIPLHQLSNRPQRHKGYKTKTFAAKHEGMHIGITKAFLTHSQWLKCPFNQLMTPYTAKGRDLYLIQFNKKRQLPLNRPPLYDITTLKHIKENNPNNFEYYMNREYAYNREKGKCKICGHVLKADNRHCHRVSEQEPIDKVNKVSNLVWVCYDCDRYIHDMEIPENFERKKTSKILKYREKLKSR